MAQWLSGQRREQSMSMAGSLAAERCEPGQVRKEAALSGSAPGAWERPTGVDSPGRAGGRTLEGGVHGHLRVSTTP